MEIRNPEAGVSISIPKSWKRQKSDDPEVVVLAQGGKDAVRLKVSPLKGTVSAEAFKELGPGFRDQIEEEGNVIGFLVPEPRAITLNGVIGWHYIYTFVEPISGEEGVRSRYFLFHGAKLIQLILQTRPAANFTRAAPVFDRISQTLRSQPRLVPGGSPAESPAGGG